MKKGFAQPTTEAVAQVLLLSCPIVLQSAQGLCKTHCLKQSAEQPCPQGARPNNNHFYFCIKNILNVGGMLKDLTSPGTS